MIVRNGFLNNIAMKHTSHGLGLSHLQSLVTAKHQLKNFALIPLNYIHWAVSGKCLAARDFSDWGSDAWTLKSVLLDLLFSPYQLSGSYGRRELEKPVRSSALPVLRREPELSLRAGALTTHRGHCPPHRPANIPHPNNATSYTKQLFWTPLFLCSQGFI